MWAFQVLRLWWGSVGLCQRSCSLLWVSMGVWQYGSMGECVCTSVGGGYSVGSTESGVGQVPANECLVSLCTRAPAHTHTYAHTHTHTHTLRPLSPFYLSTVYFFLVAMTTVSHSTPHFISPSLPSLPYHTHSPRLEICWTTIWPWDSWDSVTVTTGSSVRTSPSSCEHTPHPSPTTLVTHHPSPSTPHPHIHSPLFTAATSSSPYREESLLKHWKKNTTCTYQK